MPQKDTKQTNKNANKKQQQLAVKKLLQITNNHRQIWWNIFRAQAQLHCISKVLEKNIKVNKPEKKSLMKHNSLKLNCAIKTKCEVYVIFWFKANSFQPLSLPPILCRRWRYILMHSQFISYSSSYVWFSKLLVKRQKKWQTAVKHATPS